jgi:hypothetical protein
MIIKVKGNEIEAPLREPKDILEHIKQLDSTSGAILLKIKEII